MHCHRNHRARPDFARAVAKACEHRDDWYRDQLELIARTATPGTVTATRRRVGPLLRQLARLRHRPDAVHRKAPPRLPASEPGEIG